MPKRGRGRGGSRGGRGRPGRGGRGGYIGGKHNKYNKKKNRNTKTIDGDHVWPSSQREFPELHDLSDAVDFLLPSNSEHSLRAAAARGSKRRFRLQDEALNTEENMENTMKLPLRKRPVEFVKASTFDPSNDIIRKLKEKEDYLEKINKNEVSFVKTEANDNNDRNDEVEDDDQDEVSVNAVDVEMISDDNEAPADVEEDGKLLDPPKVAVEKTEVKEVPILKEKRTIIKNKLESVPDDQLFFKDEEGDNNINKDVRVVKVDEPYRQIIPPSGGANTEYNPTISVGHVLLSTSQASNGDVQTFLPAGKSKTKDIDFDQSIYELDENDEDLLDLNKSQNKDLYQSYNRYISRVMQNLADSDEEDDEDYDDGDNEDDLENAKDLDQDMFAELDEDFEEEAKFIAGSDFEDEDSDNQPTTNDGTTTNNFGKLNLKESEDQKEDNDPEYGFLPEDYESFDNSSVDVINIRYGAGSNQYFMKSFMLTGSYDFSWVDQDMFQDFLIENGMPEHRLNAYFKHVQGQLAPPEEPEEKDYDIPFSDSDSDSEEEIGNDKDDYDDEGLDELIKYTTKYDGVRQAEYETKTLKTRGKGRKKELDLDHIADDDLRQSLADQYQAQRHNKKGKKRDRESNVAREHYTSKDISLKYPYTLYVNDFRTEFEEFLHDPKRNALTFPPLDPHGNKTLMKFAYLYNMKSRKFGQGKQQHVVAVKNKRTFHSIPDYHSIGLLCKQRPVFNRIDQKRPRVEVEAEESKSSRRGKPSKAHVKEGDIVGADAPEIASDNIGRRLLEKLGWKSGQGLGSDNRGIPEPVIAKVKKTKLGLR